MLNSMAEEAKRKEEAISTHKASFGKKGPAKSAVAQQMRSVKHAEPEKVEPKKNVMLKGLG